MGLNYTAVDQSIDVTKRRISKGICLVAMGQDTLIGTVVVNPPNLDHQCPYFARPGVATLQQFGVATGRQNNGIGSRLLKQAELLATGEGFVELALDTAEPAHQLIAFCERRGYTATGFTQWDGKRYRSLVMSKTLSS